MDDKTKKLIVSAFNSHILSPVLYMDEYDDSIDLICYCKQYVDNEDVKAVVSLINLSTGLSVEIFDIREFDEIERLEILHHSELIYSDGLLAEQLFEQTVIEDVQIMLKEREAAYTRYEDNRSPYVQ